MAEMSRELAEGTEVEEAFAELEHDGAADATVPADKAVKTLDRHHLERTYRAAMSALVEVDTLR